MNTETLDRKYSPVFPDKDDHHLVCWMDIRQDSMFSIGYGYSKVPFKLKPDTDKDIRSETLYSIF